MSKKKKKSLLLRIVAALALLVVLLLVLSIVFINNILKGAVEKVGSTVTKSEVSINKVKLSPLKGELLLDEFKVGNPEGYKTDEAFSLGRVFVALRPASLLSDTIKIKEITILEPALTYEVGLGNSNLGTILDNVKSFVPEESADKPEKEKKPKPEKEGKKVEIEQVQIKGGKVRLSAKLLGGAALPIPLPEVELHDIGKAKDGAEDDADKPGMIEASAMILNEMLTGAIKAVGSGAKDLLKGGKELLESSSKAALESGKAALESGSKAAAESGKAALEGGKAALEGGKAALEGGKATLEDGGKAAAESGKAALESGKKLGQGLLKSIGVGDKKEAEEK
ncbi:MAG: AsmA family protein [Lentisphaeria bacterium]|jgi:hypothetical protein